MADPEGEIVQTALQYQINRRTLLKRLGQAGLLAAGGSILVGCGGESTSAGVISENLSGPVTSDSISSLNWSITKSADSLDIAQSFTSQTGVLSSLGYDTLVILDHELQIAPWTATMVESSLVEYRFDLREDVKFWDGTRLTAEDVVWSYARHLDPELSSAVISLLGNVESVKAVSDSQVMITLSSPDPTFKYAASIIQIFKKAQGIEAGSAFGSPTAIPIGTGQYCLTEYTTGGGITGELNPYYWGVAPSIQKISVKVVENPETIRVATQQGANDGMFDVPGAQLSQWNKTPDVRVGTATGLSPLLLRFPMTVKPFDDLKVRQAIAHCIDREGIVKSVLAGAGEPAVGLPSRGHWQGVLSNGEIDLFLNSLPAYSFDLDRARSALAASTVSGGFSADIYVSTDADISIKSASSLAANAAMIGIKLNLKVISLNELQQDYLIAPGKKQGLVLSSTAPTYPDPTDMLSPFFSSDPDIGYLNASGFADPAVQLLLQQQRGVRGTERVDLLQQITRIGQEQLPVAPIAWINATAGIRGNYNLNDFDAFTYYRPWAQTIGVANS
ncbi:hypothetical protein G9444_0627 [Rhodococcus erythropolis]|uniref:Solute-binding protein family 5 domain-containing protein n=1 Tax=Rhodococcus erythropolis TaxID=1833 RepID=A0A6G9CMI1_RHOER|nr:hypothetical protein G9444_0627 [Rhodococcus erythropolis]